MTAGLLGLTLLGGCWRSEKAADPAKVAFAEDAAGSDIRSYVSRESADGPQAPPPDEQGLSVPPDSASVSATVKVRAETADAAVKQARDVAQYVGGLWAEDPYCAASVLDYSPVHQVGSEAGASFSVSVSADLKGLHDTLARMARVEDCLSRFRDLAADPDLRGVSVTVGAMVATVEDPAQYRTQLLRQRLAPLHAVAGLGDVPEQFDAARVRCTSAGEVRIVRRSLGGVRLVVDFGCVRS